MVLIVDNEVDASVAPPVGARVEIFTGIGVRRLPEVAPPVGARVEISISAPADSTTTVAPPVGARVEIDSGSRTQALPPVAPPVGARVEIRERATLRGAAFQSPLPWGRELKLRYALDVGVDAVSRPSHRSVS